MEILRTCGLALSLAAIGCVGDDSIDRKSSAVELDSYGGSVILQWNIHADAVSAQTPPRKSRSMAMVMLAMHDAVNGVKERYQRYASSAHDGAAQPEVAAAQAAHDVLVGLFGLLPGQPADLDAKLEDSLAQFPDGQKKTRGIALGKKVAADILAARAGDGSATIIPYVPPIVPEPPGNWRPTPDGPASALEPNWGNLIPFGLASSSQFRSRRPYALTSPEYAADWREVRDYGSAASKVRSADQTAYAHFWYEPSASGWNRLARTAADLVRPNLWETARVFGLMNLAIADAYIASFDSKYFYHSWRPITAIREADTDGNPETEPADPTWTPLRATPPMMDQTSGHAAAGWAAAIALQEAFGADDIGATITMTSNTAVPPGPGLPPLPRSWDSFSQAAAENADSRVMVGIHTRQSVVDGETQGRAVGRYLIQHYLRPIGHQQHHD